MPKIGQVVPGFDHAQFRDKDNGRRYRKPSVVSTPDGPLAYAFPQARRLRPCWNFLNAKVGHWAAGSMVGAHQRNLLLILNREAVAGLGPPHEVHAYQWLELEVRP